MLMFTITLYRRDGKYFAELRKDDVIQQIRAFETIGSLFTLVYRWLTQL